MGNEDSKELDERAVAFLEQYNQNGVCEDQWLGKISILQNKAFQDQYIGVHKSLQDYADGDEETFKAEFGRRKVFQHENLCGLQDFFVRTEEELCGSSTSMEIMFQYELNNLQKDYDDRTTQQQYYELMELQHLREGVVEACAYLQRNGVAHTNLTPSNIMLNTQGNVKVGDYSMIQKGLTGYYMYFTQKTKECYLSPELFEAVKKQEMSPQIDQFKADVYALGVILLQMGTLKDPNGIYNLKNWTISEEEVESRLQEIAQRYGQPFSEQIRVLLQADPASRPTWEQLSHAVTQHQLQPQQVQTRYVPQQQFQQFQPVQFQPTQQYTHSQLLQQPVAIQQQQQQFQQQQVQMQAPTQAQIQQAVDRVSQMNLQPVMMKTSLVH